MRSILMYYVRKIWSCLVRHIFRKCSTNSRKSNESWMMNVQLKLLILKPFPRYSLKHVNSHSCFWNSTMFLVIICFQFTFSEFLPTFCTYLNSTKFLCMFHTVNHINSMKIFKFFMCKKYIFNFKRCNINCMDNAWRCILSNSICFRYLSAILEYVNMFNQIT